MAYVVDQNTNVDEDGNPVQKNQDGSTAISGAPAISSAGASVSNPTAVSAGPAQIPGSNTGASSTASKAPSSSGTFTNLQNYLDTNKDQATALGGKVAGSINDQTSAATNAINTAKTGFQNQVGQATNLYDPTYTASVAQDPLAFTGNKDSNAKLSNVLSGSYTGPSTLSSVGDLYNPASTAVNKATQTGALGQTTQGRMELLRELPGSTPYAYGGLSLDQYLVQNTDPARTQVEGAVAGTKPLGSTFDQAQADAAAQAAQAAAINKATGTQATADLSGAETDLRNQVAQRVADYKTNAEKYTNDMKALLASGQAPTELQLKQLGLTQDQFNTLQAQQSQAKQLGGAGVNFSNFLTASNPDVAYNPYSVTTAQEQARYAALAKLTGDQTYGAYMANNGTTPVAPYTFDTTSASGQLNAQIQAGQARQAQNAATAANQQAANDVINSQEKTQKTIGVVGGAIAGAQIGASVSDGVGAVIGGAIGAVAGLFSCFTAGNMIEMADRTKKPIEELKLGDELWLGGKIICLGSSYAYDTYNYKGSTVTGSHIVLEDDGVWRYVSDTASAVLLAQEEVVVYPVICENHVMICNGYVSADMAEVDDPRFDLSSEQRMAILNGDHDRNATLLHMVSTQ